MLNDRYGIINRDEKERIGENFFGTFFGENYREKYSSYNSHAL